MVLQAQSAVASVRPWVRYWARMVDVSLVNAVGGFVVAAAAPGAFGGLLGDELFELACLLVWVFVESLLLSSIGTTPGKWLLKTRLVPGAGVVLSYPIALERSLKVWWRGMGVGFPIVTLFTLVLAREHLLKTGVTSWDADQGFSVTHERIGLLRILAVCLLYVGLSLLIAVPALNGIDIG